MYILHCLSSISALKISSDEESFIDSFIALKIFTILPRLFGHVGKTA